MNTLLAVAVILSALIVRRCRERWARWCARLAALAVVFSAVFFENVHNSYAVFYSGVAAGTAFGIFICILFSGQLTSEIKIAPIANES
jgi:hypothetical protein